MMNGGMSVRAIYCSIRGFAGISIAWCKVQLYPLHFTVKKKGGWLVSLEKASRPCAYKWGVFPKKS